MRDANKKSPVDTTQPRVNEKLLGVAPAQRFIVSFLANDCVGVHRNATQDFPEQIRVLQNEKGKIDPFDLNRVGQYFGVSTQAVLVQMAARGMISWDQYKKIYTDPVFKERLLRDRSSEIGKEPQRFRDLAMKAYLMERISRERLAELLGINVAEVSEVLENYGGVKGMRDGVRLTLPH